MQRLVVTHSIDYAIFAVAAVVLLLAFSVWLKKNGRSDRTLALVWSFLAIVLFVGWFFVNATGVHERSHLRKQIAGFAPTYAHALSELGHEKIALDTPADDPQYLRMIEKQKTWLGLNPAIADIYTFRHHPDGNQLIVDSETDYDGDGTYAGVREQRTIIGELWEEMSPLLDQAFDGKSSFDGEPYTDRWGTWVSAYEPMYDQAGNVEAVLGVDFSAQQWIVAVGRARRSAIGFLAIVLTIGIASTLVIAILRANLAERQRSESQIREVAERTRLIIDTAYEAFVAIDRRGIVVDWNPQAEKMFGWTRGEAMGQSVASLILPPQHRDAHNHGLQRFLATGETKILNQILEVTALRRDGAEFPVALTITHVKLNNESTFHAFMHDISVRKEAESALLRAKQEAEAAAQAKSEFLANMSHEIRTPMNGIIGMSELLANTPLDERQAEYLGMVRLSANSLLRLLNDILDTSRIEAGRLELEHVDFSLRDCVAKSAQTLTSRAAEKNLELAVRVAPELPDHLIGDPGRLGQIIVNLVGNAVKFTDAGEVVVEVTGDEADELATLQFAVRDTGMGIPPEKQDKIFDTFSQADASTTRRFGGSGLGLAICRQLVEMMHGRIWVESAGGHGSTFFFTTRFGVQTSEAGRSTTLIELRRMPVLIVDDNATNRWIFEEMVRSWDMVPTAVPDGFAAIRAVEAANAAGEPFQLVLLDQMMPDMDGFEVAERLREARLIDDCTLLMVSSGNDPANAAKCKLLGIVRYMLKPVVESELLETILGSVRPPAQREPATAGEHHDERDRGVSTQRILLVEDGLINQRVAAEILNEHQVQIANNGKEAMDLLQRTDFDVVLMDVQMPVMDGIEATAAIRRLEKDSGEHIPIIAMTASAMKGDRERCLDAGMDSYISKPVTAEQLHAKIAEYGRSVNATPRDAT